MFNKIKSLGFFKYWFALLPVLAAMVAQRLIFLVDGRFLVASGQNWADAHNVFVILQSLAGFIAFAGVTTNLVLWNSEGVKENQKRLITETSLLSALVVLFCCCVSLIFFDSIYAHFQLDEDIKAAVFKYYFASSCFVVANTLFQVIESGFVAMGKQRLGMWFIIAQLVLIILLSLALQPDSVISYAYGKLIISMVLTGMMFIPLCKWLTTSKVFDRQQSLKVFLPELGSYMVRSVSVVSYGGLLVFFADTTLLTSYNFMTHLVYLVCMPIAAGSRLALRDSAPEIKASKVINFASAWSKDYMRYLLYPTLGVLILFMLVPGILIERVYDIKVSNEHFIFLSAYVCATILGQIGNFALIPIRALQHNKVFLKNILISELGVLVGLSCLLVYFGISSIWTGSLIYVLFGFLYLGLNIFDVIRISRTDGLKLRLVNVKESR